TGAGRGGAMSAGARSRNDGRTADRLLQVLLLFAREETLTAARIGEVSGIPQSTVYRLLDRLTASGFVRRRPDGYAAGPVAVQFAERYRTGALERTAIGPRLARLSRESGEDRKSTRLNSSHVKNSYAVFCLKKKIKEFKISGCIFS